MITLCNIVIALGAVAILIALIALAFTAGETDGHR